MAAAVIVEDLEPTSWPQGFAAAEAVAPGRSGAGVDPCCSARQALWMTPARRAAGVFQGFNLQTSLLRST